MPNLRNFAAVKATVPWLAAEVEDTIDLMGEDDWPYDIERNVKSIETMARYSHQQGLSKRLLTIGDLFVPGTLEQSKSGGGRCGGSGRIDLRSGYGALKGKERP